MDVGTISRMETGEKGIMEILISVTGCKHTVFTEILHYDKTSASLVLLIRA
jgi:hypothetical protein